MAEITFHQEMPNDLVQSNYLLVSSLILFDNLMNAVMNDDTVADLFTESEHHCNISIIFIIQSLFFKASKVEL